MRKPQAEAGMARMIAAIIFFVLTLTSAESSSASVIFVRFGAPVPGRDGQSWETAFGTLQAGIDASLAGDEVWVAHGTSSERIRLKSGVAIYGGFLGTEIRRDQRDVTKSTFTLDASGMPTGSAVTVPPGAGPDTVLDGILIYGAIASWETSYVGGGISCKDASPTLRNLTVYDCGATDGGGVGISGGGPTIEDCHIEGNRAYRGGGIFISGASDVHINRCTVQMNDGSDQVSGGSGGGIYGENVANVSMRDTLIFGNRAFTGAGASFKATAGEVVNCTIHDNGMNGMSGAGVGEGALLSDAEVTLSNTVITAGYGSTSVIKVESSGGRVPVFDHCNVFSPGSLSFEGIPSPVGQDGNISADPAFSIANGVENHLAAASPCRDAGTSGRLLTGETDLDGFPRQFGPGVDMGAYEHRTDATRLFISIPPGSAVTSRPLDPQPVVVATNQSGEVVQSFSGSVTLSPGIFTPALSGTTTVSAVNGVAAFTGISVEPLGRGYTVTASSGSLAPARSVEFRVGLPRVYLVGGFDGYDVYDGSSWTMPKTTLYSAVQATGPGGEVWVKKGTCWSSWALACGVALYGGFDGTETDRSQRRPEVNATILKDTAIDIAAYNGYPTSAPTIIDGFQLQGGPNTAIRIGLPGGPPVGVVEITHNTLSGSGPGIEANSGTLEIRDNLFRNFRYLDYERAALVWGGATGGHVVNNTFVNNQTGISLGSPALLSNNVIAFNTVGLAAEAGATGTTLRHNDIFGNAKDFQDLAPNPIGHDGNISVDPLFADLANGNYRLTFNSPVINAGDVGLVTEGERDLAGQLRAAGGGVDIGAYEYVPSPFVLSDVIRVLRVAVGRFASITSDLRFDATADVRLDLRDAVRLIRKVSGLDPNP